MGDIGGWVEGLKLGGGRVWGVGYVLKHLTVDIYVIYDIYITGKLLEVIQNQINM